MTLVGEGVHIDSWIDPHFYTFIFRGPTSTARSVLRSLARSFAARLARALS